MAGARHGVAYGVPNGRRAADKAGRGESWCLPADGRIGACHGSEDGSSSTRRPGIRPGDDRGIFEALRAGCDEATAMVDTPFASAALRAAPARSAWDCTPCWIGTARCAKPSRAAAADRQVRPRCAARHPPTSTATRHHHARPELLAAFAGVAATQALPVRALDQRMRNCVRGGVRRRSFRRRADLRPAGRRSGSSRRSPTWKTAPRKLMCHPGYAPSHARTPSARSAEWSSRALRRRARSAGAAGAVLVTFETCTRPYSSPRPAVRQPRCGAGKASVSKARGTVATMDAGAIWPQGSTCSPANSAMATGMVRSTAWRGRRGVEELVQEKMKQDAWWRAPARRAAGRRARRLCQGVQPRRARPGRSRRGAHGRTRSMSHSVSGSAKVRREHQAGQAVPHPAAASKR